MLREKSKNDFYTRKAKEEGYPARSIYKLQEINNKYFLFGEGDRVLDLGCAPGSWLSYISQKIGQSGRVLGVDLAEIRIAVPGNAVFLKKDVADLIEQDLAQFGVKYNAIVSDLAPKVSGIRFADEGRSLELCEKALAVAQKFLAPGGNFFCKIFEGESTGEFFAKVKKNFKLAKRFKPRASRKESREIYIVAKGFQGSSAT